MTELLTAAQMRAIEQAAIASGEVTGLELMERAGRGVVEAILDWRPELALTPHRAVVLCGPGNNGGDGFVVARLLKQRGWEVEVFLYGDEAKLPPDAAENCRRWRELGGITALTDDRVDARVDWVEQDGKSARVDLVVDALFGAGLTRPLDGPAARLAREFRLSASLAYEVAVDAPSGLCMDSGRPLGDAFIAELTVTFHRERVGHFLGQGSEFSGAVTTVDIGLPSDRSCYTRATIEGWVDRIDLREWNPFPWFAKESDDHKYHHGHALVLSGGVGKGGAARLSARGALRIGAGLVTVGCPPAALQENASALDAIMLAPVKGVEELAAEMAARKVNAVCIGPGFGTGERLRAFVETVTDGRSAHPTGEVDSGKIGPLARPALVLDADALTEFRDDPETLFGMLNENCVLTPHEGEFGRLFPDILAKLKEPATKGPAYSKVDATCEAAARAGCVVLFKGADTVIADPAGRCAINSAHYDRAAPWLATAGSGDALSGFITGLLARGLGAMAAAETAAWLHVECARKFGPGLIAEDLPEQLPAVFRDLGL